MNDIFDIKMPNPTFIFVDGSYYNFYRYFALLQWWKNANPEETLDDPYQNTIFIEKFKKTHVENLKQIPKKLKLGKDIQPIMIVAKDCKREDIWRMQHYPKYKSTRINGKDNDFKGGPFFKMVYQDNLFQQGGAKAILKHPHLEADDCIAISVKYLIKKYPECQIYIITSDKDYLQLKEKNIHLYNLAYKNIAENKSSTGNPEEDLWIKIIMGDVSDNIPSVFPKCGPKTAQKCYQDKEFFKKKMSDNKEYWDQYELNQKLVCFDNIPDELVKEFMSSISSK
jgi:5'-3' exonuclease